MENVLYQAGVGIASGLILSVAGYLKSYDKTGYKEKFDFVKFGTTAVLGGIVGGIVGFTGMQADVVTVILVDAGIVTIVENALKALYRKATKAI